MAIMSDPPEIDWEQLRAAALDISKMAYAPYSGLHVGAAGLTASGEIVVACNVENASYGLTLCAECGLVSALHQQGHSTLVAVCAVSSTGDPLMPCGRCRQLLMESGGPELLVDTGDSAMPLGELLPAAFGAEKLPRK